MDFERNKSFIFLIIIIVSLFFSNKADNVNNFFLKFIQTSNSIVNGYPRKLWEENVKFSREPNDEDIQHCLDSDYKYKIFYATGQNYIFDNVDSINVYDAVSFIYYI